jgi:hypothetical protein
MIRCIRIWTGSDGNSHFEEGVIDRFCRKFSLSCGLVYFSPVNKMG